MTDTHQEATAAFTLPLQAHTNLLDAARHLGVSADYVLSKTFTDTFLKQVLSNLELEHAMQIVRDTGSVTQAANAINRDAQGLAASLRSRYGAEYKAHVNRPGRRKQSRPAPQGE